MYININTQQSICRIVFFIPLFQSECVVWSVPIGRDVCYKHHTVQISVPVIVVSGEVDEVVHGLAGVDDHLGGLAVLSVLITLVLYVVFSVLLSVNLPRGTIPEMREFALKVEQFVSDTKAKIMPASAPAPESAEKKDEQSGGAK